jgi:YfiR/HmsC-like
VNRAGTALPSSLNPTRSAGLHSDVHFVVDWLCWLVLVLTVCFVTAKPAQTQSQPDEYRIKAAFLFHFAQLIDWPSEALQANDNSLLLCTLGDDSFRGEMESSVEGKTIGSRVLHVRHFSKNANVAGCHMVFVGRNESQHISVILAGLKGAPVVTVGDTTNFVEQGGVLGFCMEGNKIRFEVNLEAAERAKIKISSRLLLLARRVIGNSAR